jgi:hypothetical protein
MRWEAGRGVVAAVGVGPVGNLKVMWFEILGVCVDLDMVILGGVIVIVGLMVAIRIVGSFCFWLGC